MPRVIRDLLRGPGFGIPGGDLDHARDALRTALVLIFGGSAVAFTVFAIAALFLPRPIHPLLVGLDLATAVVCAVLSRWLGRTTLGIDRLHAVGSLYVLYCVLHAATFSLVYRDLGDVAFTTFLMIGVGAVAWYPVASIVLLALIAIITIAVSAGVGGVAAGIGATTGTLTAGAVGFAILLARRRTLAESARLREAERVASLELAAAVQRLATELDERERTEAARARAEAQLAQIQKLDAIGTLAGGVAHDINNVLAAISGVAEMGVAESAPGSQARSDFAHILAAAGHGARLTTNLLGFARRGKLRHVPFHLDQVAEEVVRLLERTTAKRITFTFEAPDGPTTVVGDPGQLSQAVMNLLLNAIDAIEAAGRIHVRLSSGLVAAGESPTLSAGERHVTLEVSDDGRGMDAETLAHAFEPFYSGRQAESERHGLGLAMVFGAMRDHHGEVVLRSTVGAGTTAILRLPEVSIPVPASTAPAPPAYVAVPLPVLVVDDEPMVRTMIRRFLEAAGISCFEAASGAEGIALLRARPGRIGLVILDVAMPEMSGTECFALMRALDPGLPILVVSGYPKDQSIEALLESGHAGYLAKPFGRDLLLTTVAQLRRPDSLEPPEGGTERHAPGTGSGAGTVLPAASGDAGPS